MSFLLLFLSFLALCLLFGYVFLQHPKFGKKPKGSLLKKIQHQPNYSKDGFQNLNPTPQFTEGASMTRVLWEFFTKHVKDKTPKTALRMQSILWDEMENRNALVWFGHSSYLIQLDGIRLLVDPIFTDYASPVHGAARSFCKNPDHFIANFPSIDVLILTHDHWDHLDYSTVQGLKEKVNRVVCSLGVGAHLRHWGWSSDRIQEMNWGEQLMLTDTMRLDCLPARHFSGRVLVRNRTLWSSFALLGSKQIFLGGDGGYDTHFKSIGTKYKEFDLAILECGQYDKNWKYLHLMPGEQIRAAQDLAAKAVLPVHWGKFALAHHPWKEPIEAVSKDFADSDIALFTPELGRWISLDEPESFTDWWNKTTE